MYKAIIFDIDNTLYAYDPCNCAGTSAMKRAFSNICPEKKDDFEKLLVQSKAEVKKHTVGTAACHNRMLYAQRLCEFAGCFTAENTMLLYNAYWDAFLSEMTLFDGVNTLLQKLKKEGFLIGFCTDLTVMIQMRKLCRLGLSDIADAIVTSEESGAEKPSVRPFSLIMEKLNVSPDSAVMIGDDYKKDICGAENVGMTAIQIGKNCRHNISASDFNSLSELLEEMCS